MRLYSYLRLGLTFSIILVIFYFYSVKYLNNTTIDSNNLNEQNEEVIKITKTQINENKEVFRGIRYTSNDIVVAVVACEDRFSETLNMIKSALMFSKEKLNFIVIAEFSVGKQLEMHLTQWRSESNDAFNFNVMELDFPLDNRFEWKTLFKPCAAQRLFLPTVLKHVDSILYMDTDTLFLTPVESIWQYFQQMNSSQMAALAPEHEDPNVGWYNRFARHPYYGKLGVNSGVMLMNLTRMRLFQWDVYVVPIYKKYKLNITWGDQDIINIIFHFHPGKLFIYSCRYNYRPDHCMYMSVCKPAEKLGVAVVHGSRGFFHSEKQPVFQAIYEAFEGYSLGEDVYKKFYKPLMENLDFAKKSNCGNIKDVFLKSIRQLIEIKEEN